MPTKREHFQHSLRAQFLGEKMRNLREERGLTLKYVAGYLGVEFSTLARYERAEWPFRRDHVMALLDVYGVYDERERTQLVDLAANAWRINQWEPGYGRNSRSGVGDDLTTIDHWWIQTRAEELCVYATSLIPELLQTRDYAEAVLVQRTEANSTKVDIRVRELVTRQEVLDEKPPKRLTALIEESALTRPVGGRAVLQQQLEHLLRVVERPHVKVRILPTSLGLHEGVEGPFTLCLMPRPYPPIALVEHLGGRLALEDVAADWYRKAFERLSEQAASNADSANLVMEALASLSQTKPGKSARSRSGLVEDEAVAA